MAAIDDLLLRVEDKALRERLQQEISKLHKQKKFGLVFEEHLPECTPLYEIPVKKGALVAVKGKDIKDIYAVLSIDGDTVKCVNRESKEIVELPLNSMVTVAEFGDPIYPQLIPIDTVENAPDSDLWHTLIQADNYHALQLLEYLYAGKVDCIYIDPPYNTGARDWKYNNAYVDTEDSYRHSKWLSMMKKRLNIAKRLLKPTGFFAIAIDGYELFSVGLLLDEIFNEDNRIGIVTVLHNPKGRNQSKFFSANSEYMLIYANDSHIAEFCKVAISEDVKATFTETDEQGRFRWEPYLRARTVWSRELRPDNWYPIYVSRDLKTISSDIIEDAYVLYPQTNSGDFCWKNVKSKFDALNRDGYFKVFIENNKPVLKHKYRESEVFKNVWLEKKYQSEFNGTNILKAILCDNKFNYPKSIYLMQDVLKVLANKNALIVDFFAGSGTTLHAVNLLNAEDGGNRRCIMITNNEVSEAEAKKLTGKGYQPGDPEWEQLGIAQSVTWPRTVCSIQGHDIKGKPLKGNYVGSNVPMSNGFKANAAFFKLGFLDKRAVEIGRQFKELLPILWMKAGAHGACPELLVDNVPDMMILPKNHFAVLTKESSYLRFEEEVNSHPEIETVYIVTDSESGYREMIKHLNVKNRYQLYRDYLDNFRINARRDLR